MSHIDPGPLATYESLADPHLTGYFNNSRMRKHLRRMGLITSRGEIISEKVFRLNNARKEHQRHIRDVLAQAIVHKALDMERHRQMHIKSQLEEIGKIERVRRVRAERALRGDEDILPLLIPKSKRSKKGKKSGKNQKVPILQTVADSDDYEQRPPQSVGYPALPDGPPYNTRAERMTTQYPNVEVDNQHLYELDRDALRSFTLNLSQFDLGSGVSPYNVPPPPQAETSRKKQRKRPATATGVPHRPRMQRPRSNARSLRLHRREPPMMHRSQIHTLARVTFKYLGKMVHLDHEEEDPRDDIVVMQQHCGGENLRIFKGMLMKGDKFVIISRRHRNFPFSLTFYLNGVQVERLSTCCEYKHKTGHKLGAKSSHFGIVKVDGSQPCFKCLIGQGKLKTRPDPTPPTTGGRTKPSQQRRKPGKKLRGVDEKKHGEYAEDFQSSSKSSTTTEDVQTDGPRLPSEISSSEVSSDSSPLTSEDESTSSDEDSSDSESELPSLKPGDDTSDDSSSNDESVDSQKPSKSQKPQAAKQKRIKSPQLKVEKPKTPSAGKERKKSPGKERVKSPAKDRVKSPLEKSVRTPTPIKTEAKSPPPPVLKVESSSESSVKNEKEKKKSSVTSESLSSLSSSDSGDTVEEAPMSEPKPTLLVKEEVTPDERPASPIPEEVKGSKLEEITKQPQKSESISGSSSSSSDSDTESVKNKSSDDGKSSKDESSEDRTDDSILPLIKGKSNADLRDRKLSKAQIDEIIKYFNEDPGSITIQQLNLEGCKIGSANAKVLLNSLLRSKALKSLNMSGNNLGDDCVEYILEVCQKNPIEHLSMANNPLLDSGCENLFTGFARSQATVVTAKIQKKVSQSLIASVLQDSRNEMSDELGTSISSASSMSSLASTTVSETVFLQSLDVSNTRAGHGAFISLGHYLSLNPKLSHLNVSENSISTTALEAMLKPLADGANKNLKVLHMNRATLDDRHAELLAKNLVDKARLTELSVKGNRITENGIERLEEYKESNKSLVKLVTD